MTDQIIQRLDPEHSGLIRDCTWRVYGDRYAHAMFYDPEKLQEAMETKQLMSVGAINEEGILVGHMAMTNRGESSTPELGNTMVDPAARGDGLAWQIGAELIRWCQELGYEGFLHYPTTEHTIMQKQSVKKGFETGLMLSYIPGDNDLRQAATIVYEPVGVDATPQAIYVPRRYRDFVEEFASASGLNRKLLDSASQTPSSTRYEIMTSEQRAMGKVTVFRSGSDLVNVLQEMQQLSQPCLHLDFLMDDPSIDPAVEEASEHGFVFCGWLPGYQGVDVLRLQKWTELETNETPELANQEASRVLERIKAELGR